MQKNYATKASLHVRVWSEKIVRVSYHVTQQ